MTGIRCNEEGEWQAAIHAFKDQPRWYWHGLRTCWKPSGCPQVLALTTENTGLARAYSIDATCKQMSRALQPVQIQSSCSGVDRG